MNFRAPVHTIGEVISMSYVNPAIRAKFDSMPPELREHILQMDVKLETMSDLMACLERIVAEGELSTRPGPLPAEDNFWRNFYFPLAFCSNLC